MLKECFLDIYLKHYCDFKECSSRYQLCIFAILWLALFAVIALLLFLIKARPAIILAVLGLIFTFSIPPILSLIIRRLHDADFSGMWVLIVIIPAVLAFVVTYLHYAVFSGMWILVPFGFIVLLIFMLLPTVDNNRYIGTLDESGFTKLAKVLLIAFVCLSAIVILIYINAISRIVGIEEINTESQSSMSTQNTTTTYQANKISSDDIKEKVNAPITYQTEATLYFENIKMSDNEQEKRRYELAMMNELMTENKFPENIQTLKKLAYGEDADAQFVIGILYDTGAGVAQDSIKANEWFKAAFKGYLIKAELPANARQKRIIGDMYFYGLGIEEDREQAVLWYGQAALLRDAQSMYKLARIYELGLGVPVDKERADSWYKKADAFGR
jgi:uncharacterized membrane protein YhaH (DUF805 family)